ncbi:MAG TPA: nucleotidyltransferase domain-containing protein [Chthonomonadaceae bacterium]|nr:nucleotidyltransferase domain-containing protein [Chthonomonadaceae bacterium]
MTEQSLYLREIARRIVREYTALESARAAMLSGSAAEGHADRYSDIDMMVYYDALPTDAELEEARIANGGGTRIWQAGDRAAGAVMEAYPVAGVECQIVHVTTAAWERDMGVVLEQHVVETPLHKALSGLLVGIPLYGDERIAEWKARAAAFPEPLRAKMAAHYLSFFPIWGMRERFFSRDAVLWFHQIRVETLQNLLGALAGVNRRYYTTFQFKRTADFVATLGACPEALAARLEEALAAEPDRAAVLLEALVRETVGIVEHELPDLDTATARGRIDHTPRPWSIDLESTKNTK